MADVFVSYRERSRNAAVVGAGGTGAVFGNILEAGVR